MASFLSWLPCCGRQYDDRDEINERTALLNPDILPEAPSEPITSHRSTEQERIEQDYLRTIIDQACSRFVNITSSNPFDSTNLSSSSTNNLDSDPSSISSSPTRRDHRRESRRTSGWRPNLDDDDSHGSASPFDSNGARETKRRQGKRPASSHSLKTLPRNLNQATTRTAIRASPLSKNARSDIEDELGDEDQSRREEEEEEEGEEDERFETYKTAFESNGDEEGEDSFRPPMKTGNGPTKRNGVKDVFSDQGGKQQQELQKAIADLEQSVKSFKLKPSGPIIAEISG